MRNKNIPLFIVIVLVSILCGSWDSMYKNETAKTFAATSLLFSHHAQLYNKAQQLYDKNIYYKFDKTVIEEFLSETT